MATLDPQVAADWLKYGPPVMFVRDVAKANAAAANPTLADWRFVKIGRMPKSIARLKKILIADFADAPAQVRNVGKAAWQESDAALVIDKLCDVLDEFRDNWATFSQASKTWLTAWANKRGIKRKNEA